MRKCKLSQNQVQYLGQKIEKEDIQPILEKIKAIVGPTILPAFNYYYHFMPGLASKCACLNDLLFQDAK